PISTKCQPRSIPTRKQRAESGPVARDFPHRALLHIPQLKLGEPQQPSVWRPAKFTYSPTRCDELARFCPVAVDNIDVLAIEIGNLLPVGRPRPTFGDHAAHRVSRS